MSKDLEENIEEESDVESSEEHLEPEEEGTKNMEPEEEKEIKKVGSDTNESIAFYPPVSKKKSKKSLYIIIILVVVLATGGFFLRDKLTSLVPGKPAPTSTPSTTGGATPTPVPTPKPLIKSEWSFEILNGTATSGQAKKLADKLKELGYPVVKVGNADKQNYETTQILVKADLVSKIDLVVADLRDAVKIASVAGELKEGTASARIIIGKDLEL